MGGESTQLLKKIIDEFYCIQAIILSDHEGVHICSSFAQPDKKQLNEKFIQTATLLISAVGQTEGNLIKTKTYTKLKAVNYYFMDYLIHLARMQNITISLFLLKDTNVQLAREISISIAQSFEKLNNKIAEIQGQFK